ncbi:MAG: family 43 glycosylhydrolase [Bacteroidota bacterium]|nr:family 43 glycosylhydrolase [Bacteroidota bacterium]
MNISKNMKPILTGFLFAVFVINVFGVNKQPASKKSDVQTFTNPVLGGDYPDPSILRVGNDFYMTHSSFNYYPGLLIWHSTDLIHWERVTHALNKNVGSVWAPDFVKVKDTYYIYFPAGGTLWAVYAKSPAGPWSEPVDLKIHGFIDPGHLVAQDGTRYLYLSNGYYIKLTADGLAADGEAVKFYEGWQFPQTWSTECFCMESPKATYHDGYYYQTVAEGGTAGPATSHMVVTARSKNPLGPWENSPYNPIIHTENRDETWWSQGHGTLVDDAIGKWWILYHAYEKGFHTLGRQTLMLPVEWTKDGWFRIPQGVKSGNKIQKPQGKPSNDGIGLSDNFSGNTLGLQWQFYKLFKPERVQVDNGKLTLTAEGNSFAGSSPLLVNAADKKYEMIVEYAIEDGVTAGLTLYYNEKANVRLAVDSKETSVIVQQSRKAHYPSLTGNHGFLRILNDNNEVSFYQSADGKNWTKFDRSIDISGYNHNVFAEFLSLRAGLFAFGNGKATFRNFIYRK